MIGNLTVAILKFKDLYNVYNEWEGEVNISLKKNIYMRKFNIVETTLYINILWEPAKSTLFSHL